MRWIIDTSAWGRRDIPAVKSQLTDILAEEDDGEFVLSPIVLLELMRGPQGDAVAREHEILTSSMQTLPVDAQTFELAAAAMQRLASVTAEGHRLPVPDLVTAALAHQHGCGVVHLDDDFEQLAQHGGLRFEARRIELPEAGADGGADHPQAGGQRALKRELWQLLHQKPIAEAQEILERIVQELRRGSAG